MNAYEFLTRPRVVMVRLKRVKEHIEILKSSAERSTASFGPESQPVSHTRNPFSMQDIIVQLAEAKEEEKRLKEELAEVSLEVTLVLANLEDKDIYNYLSYRFLDCMTVRRAACKAGYSYSWGRWAQGRGIHEVQTILDNMELSGGDKSPA